MKLMRQVDLRAVNAWTSARGVDDRRPARERINNRVR